MPAPSASKDRVALTVAAAGGVVVTLAVFNVAGWGVTWKDSIWFALLFCGVALFSEFLGFNLAIAAERQWALKRKDRFAACVYSLLVCAIVNVASGHNAWTKFEDIMLHQPRMEAQAGLDRERGALLDEIVTLDRQLDAARPPPAAALGPQARGEARMVYQIEVDRLQPRRERLQGRLDALPVVAPERHIVDPLLVWFAFAAIEVMKAIVLWGIGVGIADLSASVRSAMAGLALRAQQPAQTPEPVQRPEIVEPPLTLELALEPGNGNGRALLDKLVTDNVVSMKDVASKHAARPRPGRARKKAA